MAEPLLDIRGLKTHFATDDGMVQAVDGVDITIGRGETVGVVGESGCGKTVTALSVLKLIAMPPGKIVAGQVLYQGRDLVPLGADEMDRIRAKDIAMVFQEPMTSLNPVYTVGEQIAEVRASRTRGCRAAARTRRPSRCCAWCRSPIRSSRLHDYPHQFSGGMRQRVMIAMALSCNPEAADRRRADDGARRHHPGADPRTAGRHEVALRHGDHADHPRHGRGGRDRAARRRDVCRQGDRGSAGRAAVRQPAPPLHAGPDPLDPAHRHGGDAARRGSRRSPAWCRACSTRRPAAASRRAAATPWPSAARRSRRCATSAAATGRLRAGASPHWRSAATSDRTAAPARQGPDQELRDRRRPVRGAAPAWFTRSTSELRHRARARRSGWSANPARASRPPGAASCG